MGLCGCSASDLSILGPIPGLDQMAMQSQQQAAMKAALPGPISATLAAKFEKDADNGGTFQQLWTQFSPYPFERQQRANLESMGDNEQFGGTYGYLKFAADRGDPEGEFYLALLYRNLSIPGANGVYGQIPDVPIGAPSPMYNVFYGILRKHEYTWMDKASHAGIARAQEMLADMYYAGVGCEKNTTRAVYWYTQSANQGYAPAELSLGCMYMYGFGGVVQNQAEGFSLFHAAAEQSVPDAEYQLARAYHHGWGVAANHAKMQYWLTLACNADFPDAQAMQARIWLAPLLASARQGNAAAAYRLGCCYFDGKFNGKSIPQNYSSAVYWFRKSAHAGNVGAECFLGYCYEDGFGMPSWNFAKALHWYKLAVKAGSSDAENNIGTMYQRGDGLPKSENKALYWYCLAARKGNTTAKNNIRDLVQQQIRNHPTHAFSRRQRSLIAWGIGAQTLDQEEEQQRELYAQESTEEQAQIAADDASPPDPDEITPDDEIMPDDEGPGP